MVFKINKKNMKTFYFLFGGFPSNLLQWISWIHREILMAKMHCQGIEEFNWRLVRNHLTTPRVGEKRQMGRLLFTPGGEIWWVFVGKGKDWIMKQAWNQKTLQLLYYWYMDTQSYYLDGYHRNINETWNNHETTICSLLLSWLIQDGSQMDSKDWKDYSHGNSCPSLREPFWLF